MSPTKGNQAEQQEANKGRARAEATSSSSGTVNTFSTTAAVAPPKAFAKQRQHETQILRPIPSPTRTGPSPSAHADSRGTPLGIEKKMASTRTAAPAVESNATPTTAVTRPRGQTAASRRNHHEKAYSSGIARYRRPGGVATQSVISEEEVLERNETQRQGHVEAIPEAMAIDADTNDHLDVESNVQGETREQDASRENRKEKGPTICNRKCKIAIVMVVALFLIVGSVLAYLSTRVTSNTEATQIQSDEPTPPPFSLTDMVGTESPSVLPTPFPTEPVLLEKLLYAPPSESDCNAIALNQTTAGREMMLEANFGLELDVVLSNDTVMTDETLEELLDAIQEKILPSLTGCNILLDEFVENWRFVIFDVFVKGALRQEETCRDEDLSPQNCHRVFMELSLFLKGRVRFLDIMGLISSETMDLSEPFLVVKMVGARGLTPTASPTNMPSTVPSEAPSQAPTLLESSIPSVIPSNEPSEAPSQSQTPFLGENILRP